MVAERWARETWERFEADEITYARARELYGALTDEAKGDLRSIVDRALYVLRDGSVEELQDEMPPCEFRFARFVADLIDNRLADEMQNHIQYTSDGAWYCDCEECIQFVSRVEGLLQTLRTQPSEIQE